MLNQVEKKTLQHNVYKLLLKAIISGEIQPGDHLDEKELTEKLGVSRTPLREAINRLAQDGVILELPYRGKFVRKFTPQEVNDIYEVRKSLEVLAICLAVRNMADDELNEITEIVHAITEAQESGNLLSYSELDAEFHEKLALYSRNKTLIRTLDSLAIQVKLIRHMTNKKSDVVSRSQFERVQILNALKLRDEKLATAFMEEHIDNVRRDAIAIIEALNDLNNS
jgi:DNA-binding GntR family transcriptional regulator